MSNNQQQLRQRILDYSMEQFISQGVKNVKVDDIAAALTISKRTLYAMFSDKEQLLLESINAQMARSNKEMEKVIAEAANPLEGYMKVLNLKLQELQNVNPVFYKEIGKYESCIKLFESERVRRQAHALEFIEKCVAEGLFLPDINYKLITQMTDIIGTALNENCLYEKYPLEDIIHSIHLSLIRGISTAKGLEVINAIYHK